MMKVTTDPAAIRLVNGVQLRKPERYTTSPAGMRVNSKDALHPIPTSVGRDEDRP